MYQPIIDSFTLFTILSIAYYAWKKLRVVERLSPWTQDSSCPLCRSVETLDHPLGDSLFHRVMFALLKKVWEPLQIQGQQYDCGHILVQHSFKSPQGIAQWSVLAAHYTLHNSARGASPPLTHC